MKYLAAYTLLVLAGNKNPSTWFFYIKRVGEADIVNLLKEVSIDADKDAVKRVVDALKGKNLEEVIAEGSKKTQNLSFGGGAPAPAAAPVAAKAVV